MKPVNLNQLLFHPKSDSLSFFWPCETGAEKDKEFELFLEDMSVQMNLQEKTELVKLFEKYRKEMKKIFKNHFGKTCGYFLSEELQGFVVLEQRFDPYCMIGQTFHVRPLLEELFVNPEFLLVNVSLYDIKIFRGDFRHLEIVQHYEFDQLPKNFNSFSSRVYAPQYMGLVPFKSILAMKTIAGKIKDMILYESLPVVVTGIEEMKANFLRYLDDSPGVIGNFQEDFYEKTCMEILEKSPMFRYAVTDYYSAQLKERIKRLMKSRRIVSDLNEVVKLTYSGKVQHLVIPSEQKLWGKFDSDSGEFIIHKRAGKTSIDILNELAEEVMRQGGKIQILGPHFFPINAHVLAVIKGAL